MSADAGSYEGALADGEAVDAPREKAWLSIGMIAYWLVGYYGVGLRQDPADARVLRTPLDDMIPFLPASIWVYSCVYTAMLLPLFVVRCKRLFRRVVVAYAFVISVSATCFAAFPVTSLGFRPELTSIADAPFHLWGLKLNLFLDPPVNLMPSLHLSIATLAALVAWQVRRAYGVLALALTVAIAVSVLTLKQHYWLDAVAGFVLGGAAWAIFVRRAPAHPTRAAYGWAGPATYAAFHASALLFVYALYRAGFRPWSG
jgi:membrane-associated phospholipid phosphatase